MIKKSSLLPIKHVIVKQKNSENNYKSKYINDLSKKAFDILSKIMQDVS